MGQTRHPVLRRSADLWGTQAWPQTATTQGLSECWEGGSVQAGPPGPSASLVPPAPLPVVRTKCSRVLIHGIISPGPWGLATLCQEAWEWREERTEMVGKQQTAQEGWRSCPRWGWENEENLGFPRFSQRSPAPSDVVGLSSRGHRRTRRSPSSKPCTPRAPRAGIPARST